VGTKSIGGACIKLKLRFAMSGVIHFIHGLILLTPNLLLMIAVAMVVLSVGSIVIEEENVLLGTCITVSTAFTVALAILGIWGC
jgi:hypothetical protein